MPQHVSRFAVALCLLSLSLTTHAQAPAKVKKTPASDASSRAAADPLAAERRAQATSLLTSLADEARGFHDETLRARVQAQAADTLWTTDQERAKALFRRAWEAAEVADRENQRQRDTARRAQGNSPRLASGLNRPDMRREVLRLAAKRDRALGEELLARLEEAKKQEDANLTSAAASAGSSAAASNAAPQPPGRDPYATPPEIARRLSLAMDFLNDGDTERAIQFADSALQKPYELAVEFLVMLREKNPEAADQRYTALLGRTVADPESDANSILLLASYVLTPHMYMVVQPGGNLSTSQRRRDIRPPADMPAAVRQAFGRAAVAVLMRPLPQSDQDRTTTGRDGAYFVIARLLPFIEQYAPERAADLRARLAALTPDVPAPERAEMDHDLQRGLASEPDRDPVQESLDQLNRATTPEARDLAYMNAAMAATFKNDARARDFADKIDNADLRQQVRSFVDFAGLNQAIQKKDGAEALRLAQAGTLSHVQRAWGLTEAARLLLENDRPRAIEALEAAATEARAIDGEDADRPRSFVAVATQFFRVDQNRAWELMTEAVKAANAAPEFTGADAGLAARVQTRTNRSTINFDTPTLDLGGIFATLAQEDMNRAVELARTFTGEAPRATATLAVARAILTEKPATKPKARG
ncbi:MAG TPA: hypothetical protein VE775_10080 [Pyrinomonadaceae bacterium]|nr:hypothetical protein [Pyrinomonadaceae bacterium]